MLQINSFVYALVRKVLIQKTSALKWFPFMKEMTSKIGDERQRQYVEDRLDGNPKRYMP